MDKNFKELCDYIKSNIKNTNDRGGLKTEIQLKTADYTFKNMLDLIDHFSWLGFKIEAYGFTSETVRFIIQWTEKEAKNL